MTMTSMTKTKILMNELWICGCTRYNQIELPFTKYVYSFNALTKTQSEPTLVLKNKVGFTPKCRIAVPPVYTIAKKNCTAFSVLI